ncbi:MAG: hypothetical protein K8F60_09695 [Melioribacteraceae bacterium]|nr:hypothetical protein [Melioribacteraceae bacterium]
MADVVITLEINGEKFEKQLNVHEGQTQQFIDFFNNAGKQASNTVSGLKNRLETLNNEFESVEIGSKRFNELKSEIKETESQLEKAVDQTEEVKVKAENVRSAFAQWSMIITGINQGLELAGKLYNVIQKPIGIAAEFQQYEVQFEVLLGNLSDAKNRIEELSLFASKTPFQFPEVIRASRQLEVLTKGALSTGEGLRLVGDVAAGTGVRIDELSMWFGRLYDSLKSGRPAGEALMRLQELGAVSGEARSEIERLTKSNADAEVVWKAVTDEMSRYSGMMQKQSETYEGMVSNLEDSIILMQRTIGNYILPIAQENVQSIISMIEMITESFKTVNERAKESYNSQKEYVDRIEKSIPPLLKEYDSLKSKVSLSAAEQETLNTVVQNIASIIPQAVSGWNKYGGALDINRDKLIRLMEAEKARLKYLNKEAIKAQEDAIKVLDDKILNKQTDLNRGYQTNQTMGGIGVSGTSIQVREDYSSEQISAIQTELEKLNEELEGAKANLASLKGDNIIIPTADSEDHNTGGTKADEIKKELELQKLRKELNEVSLQEYQSYLEKRISTLNKTTAEEKQIYLQYLTELKNVNTELNFTNVQKEFELYRLKKELNEISLEDYENYLQNRLTSLNGSTFEEKKLMLQFSEELKRIQNLSAPDLKQEEPTYEELFGDIDLKLATEEELQNLRIETIADGYEKEYALLELWKDRELERYANDTQAKELIMAQYLMRSTALREAEAANEIMIVKNTLSIIASMVNQNTAAGKLIAFTMAMINTYEGATKALAQGGIWGMIQMAAIIAKGTEQATNIMKTDVPQMPGFATGAAVVGENGLEIISPIKEYAEGWAQVVAATTMAVERRLTELNFLVTGESNNSIVTEEIKLLRKDLLTLIEHEKNILIGDEEIEKISRRANNLTTNESL